jgi:predicted  nucleic acid-binding Zn-ribbon protein
MDDTERQRTMDFILQQQAQFAAGMQRLEEADARASKRLGRLERTVILMAQQFRRERRDLRERITALGDARVTADERTSHLDEKMNALIDSQIRTEEALRSLAAVTERNSRDITALAEGNKASGRSNGETDDVGSDS